MKIGQVIRRWRKDAKMTLEALATAVGTDAANLSRVERGLQNHTSDGLAAIAAALGTTPATLIAEAESGSSGSGGIARPMNDEQELLSDYRRLRGSARSIARLMIAEMAKLSQAPNNTHL